jgi:ABC-type amino acid transport substrate-binding protein
MEAVMSWLIRLVFLLLIAQSAAAEVVRFPGPEIEGDRRSEYALQLLKLALSKMGPDYQVEVVALPMNQDRALLELEAGRLIDVVPMPSSAEREARLLAVRIPINKGLLGLRLGFVRKGDADRLAGVKTLDDLKQVRIAQGQGWPDIEILSGNGVPVITAPSYEGLFKMLVGERFDYFPRSALEIWDEQARNADTLEIEPHIALHYYYDAYYMLNRDNTRLAEIIRQGLEKAIADGSADRLFEQYYGERLREAHLENRVIIELTNPLLTPGTPIGRPELWYDFRRKPRT